MRYCVEYKETLSRIVIVEADSLSKAINYVRDKVKYGKLVLDADDYIDSDIEAWEASEDSKWFYEEI